MRRGEHICAGSTKKKREFIMKSTCLLFSPCRNLSTINLALTVLKIVLSLSTLYLFNIDRNEKWCVPLFIIYQSDVELLS